MASKRKKSRPTRITEEDVSKIAERPQASSYNAEDTLTQIQRYIEEGSEDTPDCLEKKLDLSGESNIECVSPVPDIKYETAPTEDDSRDAGSDQMTMKSKKKDLRSIESEIVNVSNSRELQLWKNREQQSLRRASESEEKRALRLLLNRHRQASRRQNESSEARRLRLERGRERQSNRRKNESAEERKVRLAQHRLQQADRRKNESDSARQIRLTVSRERQAARRRNESIEERELRLLKNRLRQADRRKNEASKVNSQHHQTPVTCEFTALDDPCASGSLKSNGNNQGRS